MVSLFEMRSWLRLAESSVLDFSRLAQAAAATAVGAATGGGEGEGGLGRSSANNNSRILNLIMNSRTRRLLLDQVQEEEAIQVQPEFEEMVPW